MFLNPNPLATFSKDFFSQSQKRPQKLCWRPRGSNPGPLVYQTSTLPLGHAGEGFMGEYIRPCLKPGAIISAQNWNASLHKLTAMKHFEALGGVRVNKTILWRKKEEKKKEKKKCSSTLTP